MLISFANGKNPSIQRGKAKSNSVRQKLVENQRKHPMYVLQCIESHTGYQAQKVFELKRFKQTLPDWLPTTRAAFG